LSKWFPVAMDEKNGGFFENFGQDWFRVSPTVPGGLFTNRDDLDGGAGGCAVWGSGGFVSGADAPWPVVFVGKLWDQKMAGFSGAVDLDGKTDQCNRSEEGGIRKRIGIYAAAANYKVTHDPAALDLAKGGRSFGTTSGGTSKTRRGIWTIAPDIAGAVVDDSVNPIGRHGRPEIDEHQHPVCWKRSPVCTMFGPDPYVKARLAEMFEISRDRDLRRTRLSDPILRLRIGPPRPAEDSLRARLDGGISAGGSRRGAGDSR